MVNVVSLHPRAYGTNSSASTPPLLGQVWNPQWAPPGKADAMSVAVNVMGLDAASRSRSRLRLQEFTKSLPGVRTAAVTWLG